MATRVGVSTATISNLETGRSKQIKKAVYSKVYRVLFGAPNAVDVDKDESYRRIVEGALELNETDRAAVATLVENLRAKQT